MGMLSTMAAHDLGYLTTAEMLRRLDATLTTLEGLERHRGHFLNWYDTSTRAPLHPRYVSTVDSGNLAGALITLAQGLLELEQKPQTLEQRLEGLADAASLLALASSSANADFGTRAIVTEINRLARAIAALARSTPADGAMDEAKKLATQLAGAFADAGQPKDRQLESDIEYWCRAVLDGAAALTESSPLPAAAARSLAARMAAMADGMRFDFLYDRRRRIFAIGYRLEDAGGPGRLDGSFYDLLASEARLASFVAIAKGDVPQHHWFHLGRLVTNVDGRATLMSWGGTMFEYLMPQLLMRSFPGTLLDQSCRASVRRQIEYGRQRGVPWGISESAYAFTDREGNYQYRAFGVPGLGLKRGLATDLVVAPYASALASLVSPAAAAQNFEALAQAGLDARYGFYESLDYNPRNRDLEPDAPPAAQKRPVPVRAYFAHHQGMSLVALANVVRRDAFVSRFHADPRIQATELLLQERVPREAILSEPRPAEAETAPPTLPVFATRSFRTPHTRNVHTHFLSNGRYTTALTNAGGGYSMWRDMAVTRRREDPTSDAGAHYIYLRDPWSKRVWSATHLPIGQEPDQFDAVFELDKATFRRRDGDFETQLEITVSSEDDVEVRRLTIRNRGRQTRELEVTSYVEMVLAALRRRPRAPGVRQAVHRDRSSTRRAPDSFSPAVRGRRTSRRWWASTSLAWMAGGCAARSSGRPIVRASSAAAAPTPIRRRSKARACPARLVRCSIRSPRCASGSDCRPAPPCASSLPPASRPTATPHSPWRASTRMAAPLRARSRWRSRTSTSRSSTSASTTSRRCCSTGSRHACSARTTRSSVRPILPRTSSVSRTCGASVSPAICRSCWCACWIPNRCRWCGNC